MFRAPDLSQKNSNQSVQSVQSVQPVRSPVVNMPNPLNVRINST